MLKRKFYRVVKEWQKGNADRALLVIGARQVGKTYLLNEFCRRECLDYVYLNMIDQPEIAEIFDQNQSLDWRLRQIENRLGRALIPGKTTLFIDEIQESPGALEAIKYLIDRPNPFRIVAAGSLLGTFLNKSRASFPVGRVQIARMYPLDFEEFLWANGKKMWTDEIRNCFFRDQECLLHEELLELYRQYLYVGGMPQIVMAYLGNFQRPIELDQNLAHDIIEAYVADMNKYVDNKAEAAKILSVYRALPTMLASENKKFRYRVIKPGANSRDYRMPVEWLIASQLALQCKLLTKAAWPFKVYDDESAFKLYVSDVGLLAAMWEISAQDILLDRDFMAKGALAENYVAEQLAAGGVGLHYWRSEHEAEIDFLLYQDGQIIPVEVKASDNKQSKSLKAYREKYAPELAIRVSSRNFGLKDGLKSVPLYAAYLLPMLAR